MPKSQTAALFAASAPANDGFRRQPLRAAVLSARPARLMAALDRLAVTGIDATRGDLALLLRDAPDMLVVDIEPGTVSARRLALLVAQLGWARRDLVIAVAAGRSAALGGLSFDLTFDAAAPDADLDAAAGRRAGRHWRAARPSRFPRPCPRRPDTRQKSPAPRKSPAAPSVYPFTANVWHANERTPG